MQFSKSLFFIIFLIAFSDSTNAEVNSGEDKKPILIEIIDKSNDVKLGLTKSTVYMQFNSTVKDYINQEIEQRYAIEANQFLDTQGHFLLGSVTLLESEKIEYSIDEIKEVTFENGKLSFSYENQKSFIFSDILSTDGSQALNNFYVEDLEKFYLTYLKLVADEDTIVRSH